RRARPAGPSHGSRRSQTGARPGSRRSRSSDSEWIIDGVEKARMEAFSDGVFAIAITLLVINLLGIHNRLAHHWPQYAAFAFSFLTIGVMWVNHHHLMDQFIRADR